MTNGNGASPPPPQLEIDSVSLDFGGVRALSNVRFNIYPGTIQAIIGPNGAGKTSLLNASSRDIFGCSKNRQNRIVENSTYPLDDFGFR